MKVAILGAGAMGMLFGGYLSQKNEVWLIDVDQKRIDKINADGVLVREKDGERTFHPHAVSDSAGLPPMDLVIVFVKAMYTISALETNRHLIGPDTCLMTLQNGAGHENKLLKFANEAHVIIGSTQHNSSIIDNGHVNHGGWGKTSIGLLTGDSSPLERMAANISSCEFECVTSNEVKKQIWTKLFTNTAASSLTAVLQVPLGFIYGNEHAHFLMKQLCAEAVQVANAECGNCFVESEVVDSVETVCKNGENGYTSIYADIRDGRKSEVDTISGAVIEAAEKHGIAVPYHRAVAELIRAMEGRKKQ